MYEDECWKTPRIKNGNSLQGSIPDIERPRVRELLRTYKEFSFTCLKSLSNRIQFKQLLECGSKFNFLRDILRKKNLSRILCKLNFGNVARTFRMEIGKNSNGNNRADWAIKYVAFSLCVRFYCSVFARDVEELNFHYMNAELPENECIQDYCGLGTQ